ncbi:MAG: PadR family transcriptional regulator [Micrococcaceae bacterium]
MSEPETLWPTPWIRAAWGTAVLAVLAEEDLHGYAIGERLAARGLGRPKGGSLYPLLASLEESGAVETAWTQSERGPGRRMYRLTDVGRERLAHELSAWGQLVAALGSAPGFTTKEDS